MAILLGNPSTGVMGDPNYNPSVDQFTLDADVANADLEEVISLTQFTLSGATETLVVTPTNCEVSIDGGSYTASATTAVNGDTVDVRVTASDAPETAVTATLSIGSESDSFTVTTALTPTGTATITFNTVVSLFGNAPSGTVLTYVTPATADNGVIYPVSVSAAGNINFVSDDPNIPLTGWLKTPEDGFFGPKFTFKSSAVTPQLSRALSIKTIGAIAMRRNVASQRVAFWARDSSNDPVTSGTPTFTVTKDGSSAVGAGSSAHVANGQWHYTLTQAETDAAHIVVEMSLTGAEEIEPIQVYPVAFNTQSATLGLNNLSASDVKTQADLALSDLDVPSNADLNARTIPSASYLVVSDISSLATTANVTSVGAAIADLPTAVEIRQELDNESSQLVAILSRANSIPTNPLLTNDTRLSAFNAGTGTVSADVKRFNNVAIEGAGVDGNSFRPV